MAAALSALPPAYARLFQSVSIIKADFARLSLSYKLLLTIFDFPIIIIIISKHYLLSSLRKKRPSYTILNMASETNVTVATWADFVDHSNKKTLNPEFFVLNNLRARYPGYHVSWVNLQTCDLLGYASAGHATAEWQDFNDDGYKMRLDYKPAKHRLAGKGPPGEIDESLMFGQFKYVWSGREYMYYHLVVALGKGGFGYLLAKKDGSGVRIKDGRCNVSDDLIWAAGHWTDQLHDEVYVYDNGNWVKNADMWKIVQESTWDNVILNPTVRENIANDVLGFFDSRQLYEDFEVPWKRGIIFHGVPGNGKTMTVKAIMASLQNKTVPIPSLYVKSMHRNGSASANTIHTIFSRARSMVPCLLIFEDLESLVNDSSRSYFLNEVDGIKTNDGVLIIGSVNDLQKLDPAVRDRPSRFDRKYWFKSPETRERITYAKLWQKKLETRSAMRIPDDACDIIAKMTDGFSFAYMNELFVVSLLAVARGATGQDEDENPSDFIAVEESNNNLEIYPNSLVPPKRMTVTDRLRRRQALEIDEETAAANAAASAAAKRQSELRKEALASLKLPDHLRDDSLLRVMRQQAQVLLDDIGNGVAVMGGYSSKCK